MATPDELGLEITSLIENLARKEAFKPTGVVPQVVNGLTIDESGRVLRAEATSGGGRTLALLADRTANASLSVVSGTTTILPYDNIITDAGYGTIVTGASWSFQPNVAGTYLITALATFLTSGTAANTPYSLQLYKNGAQYRYIDNQSGFTASVSIYMHGSVPIVLTPSDTIDIRVRQTSGANRSIGTGEELAFLMIEKY